MRKALLFLLLFSNIGWAQQRPIDTYLQGSAAVNFAGPAAAKTAALGNLLPDVRASQFTQYILASSDEFRNVIDALRLNKLVGSTAGGSGTTSLVSKVSVPSVLGIGVEYGSITQKTNGALTTMRGNFLGLARLAVGADQFPYCPEIDQSKCSKATRWLRRFSGDTAFEDIRGSQDSAAASTSTGPTTADLFGNDFRMASWGLRFDFTPSNNLDDPKYRTAWRDQIAKLRNDPAADALTAAFSDLFEASLGFFVGWKADAMKELQQATNAAEVRTVLEEQLDILTKGMREADPGFNEKAKAMERAYGNYFSVRDELIRQAQTHKLSLEYVNQHPQGEPNRSNIRFIYSHQPTNNTGLILTLNAAATFYHAKPTVGDAGRFRDVQVAGQMDRRLGVIKDKGPVVLTFAGYYQWMRDDALIRMESGNATPGSGIVLPGTAATLLGTKGHIAIAQAKLSIPTGSTIKFPLSLTWANRTELIKERDVRGQVGMTLDLDNLFH